MGYLLSDGIQLVEFGNDAFELFLVENILEASAILSLLQYGL